MQNLNTNIFCNQNFIEILDRFQDFTKNYKYVAFNSKVLPTKYLGGHGKTVCWSIKYIFDITYK